MSANNTPSKRSSDDDKSPSKPMLNITVLPSSLKKPKKVAQAVSISTMLTKVIHIEPPDGGDEVPCGYLLMIDGKLKKNMHTPPYNLKANPLVQSYVEKIGCLGHVFKPILPTGGRVVNRKNYPMVALFFPMDKGTSMQAIRDNVETCVIPNIIVHAHVNPCLTPIEEKPIWLDSEYTKVGYFSNALDWDGIKWVLTGMCLTDEDDGSAITREQYWLTNANNKYFFWPRG